MVEGQELFIGDIKSRRSEEKIFAHTADEMTLARAWDISDAEVRLHIARKPTFLWERLVLFCSVLDPCVHLPPTPNLSRVYLVRSA